MIMSPAKQSNKEKDKVAIQDYLDPSSPECKNLNVGSGQIMSDDRRHSKKNSLNNDSTIDLEEQTKIAEHEEIKMMGGGDLDEGLIYEDSASEEDSRVRPRGNLQTEGNESGL